MTTRRDFLTKSALASATLASGSLSALANISDTSKGNTAAAQASSKNRRSFEFPQNFGLGGVGVGNGWNENSNRQITETLDAAWNAGVRYFDTSPFYGFGLSERRMGHYLFEKNRDEFLLSTKIGRIFEADPNFKVDPGILWKGKLNFKYRLDYTAAGVRRSIEDSLQRLGLSSIDLVFVHDLSPDNADLGEKWLDQFNIAVKGAFPELTKMREEGLIKGWGMGVNRPEPILKALEVADPDVMLVAVQYSLIDHEHALDHVFPIMQQKNVKAVMGAPLNGGFLADRDRYNYGSKIPEDMAEKRKQIKQILQNHQADLRTVALQFAAAHPVVGAVIPGASTAEQAKANAASMSVPIPEAVWDELKAAKLIAAHAPVPTDATVA